MWRVRLPLSLPLPNSRNSLQDPPNYWENIVWPAYVSAHAPLFLNGDVEAGQPDSKKIEGVVLLEASELKMDGMVDRACQLIRDRLESGRKVGEW